LGKVKSLSQVVAVVWLILLGACGPLWGNPDSISADSSSSDDASVSSLTPFLPEGYNPTSTSEATQTQTVSTLTTQPSSIWISPAVPENLRQVASASGLPTASDSASATIRLDESQPSDPQAASWIYALVVPFPTVIDAVTSGDILNAWAGLPSGQLIGKPIWMSESTLAAFSESWGAPAAGSVRVAAGNDLVDSTWAEPAGWAIVPFEDLEPRWKVLSVDGQSPVHKDFDPASYPLKINFSLLPAAIPLIPTNRDPNKMTILAMTGVTALVRGTADRMERYGVLYPGEEIRSALRTADITHISNEISFMEGCPTPDPWTISLQFCSDPSYIALLEDVGTDVVELTGNHLLDYGPDATLTTLDMYDDLGWRYFGGGRNLQDSLEPALMEHNGNKLAFVGCNYAGPPNDWATETRPGSAPCDFDRLVAEIGNLRSAGYLPIMTLQYNEYYQSFPTDYEQRDFLRMASAGAVIVSGSQAHMPATMEFSGGSFVHYGLGNLFFDQMSYPMPDGSFIYDTRNVFVDLHVFYAGRYIGTELLTYVIEDYARPRPMTETERFDFLQKIFRAGGW
jgi:hypothetical protein